MKLDIQQVPINKFSGGLIGRITLARAGWDCAYYVGNNDTVLVKKDYLSIRTKSKSKKYIKAIAKKLLGTPYSFKITKNGEDIFNVERGVK